MVWTRGTVVSLAKMFCAKESQQTTMFFFFWVTSRLTHSKCITIKKSTTNKEKFRCINTGRTFNGARFRQGGGGMSQAPWSFPPMVWSRNESLTDWLITLWYLKSSWHDPGFSERTNCVKVCKILRVRGRGLNRVSEERYTQRLSWICQGHSTLSLAGVMWQALGL